MESKSELLESVCDFPFVMYYQGNYQDRPTISISEIVEWNLKPYQKKSTVRRIVYLIIEVVQNIERYSAHIDASMDSSLIFSDGHCLHLITQNTIKKSSIPELSGTFTA